MSLPSIIIPGCGIWLQICSIWNSWSHPSSINNHKKFRNNKYERHGEIVDYSCILKSNR